MRMRSILAAAVLFGTAGLAWADSDYDRCIDAAGAVDQAMGECGDAWLEREDARLNKAWKSAYGKAGESTKAALLGEQRAWNVFKEKSCLFYADADDTFGTAGRFLSFPACRAEVIVARTKALEDIGTFLSDN